VSAVHLGAAATCRAGVVGLSESVIGSDRVEIQWISFEVCRRTFKPFSCVGFECLFGGPTTGQADVLTGVTEDSVVRLDVAVRGKSV
jgi:hypothetical protein